MTRSEYNKERNRQRYPNGIDDLPFQEWYCRRCKEIKDKSLFYFSPSDSRGIRNICKECDKRRAKSYRMSRDFPRPADDTLVKCTGCKETKTAAEFQACAHKTNGLSSQCTQCYRDRYRNMKSKIATLEGIIKIANG